MAKDYADIVGRQTELSFVAPQHFYLVIEKLPEVVFNMQQVQTPSISSGEVETQSRLNRFSLPGDTFDYGTLDCTFIVDKHFKNYRSVLNWMKGIAAPESFQQWTDWHEGDITDFSKSGFGRGMSNMTLIGTDASNVPLAHWSFKNAFPISLDGPQFDATRIDMEYLQSNVSFKFTYFEHQTYTNGALNNDII